MNRFRILPPFGDGITAFPEVGRQHVAADGTISETPAASEQILLDIGGPEPVAFLAVHLEPAP